MSSQEHSYLFGWHGVVVLSCVVTGRLYVQPRDRETLCSAKEWGDSMPGKEYVDYQEVYRETRSL
jgi:hypothetical protein